MVQSKGLDLVQWQQDLHQRLLMFWLERQSKAIDDTAHTAFYIIISYLIKNTTYTILSLFY
jgi:hypothetical protein